MVHNILGPARRGSAPCQMGVRIGFRLLALLISAACSSSEMSRPSQSGPQHIDRPDASVRSDAPPLGTDNPKQLVAGASANPPREYESAAATQTRGTTPPPTSSMVAIEDSCPGTLDPALVATLQATDVQRGSRWLYPYDRTVFPTGLLPPVLQWDGAPADAIYLHMSSKSFDYKSCLRGGPAPNLAIPKPAWERAGAQSSGKNDPLQIELTLSSGGKLQRLPPLTLIFALANVKSAIYYNTYGSSIATDKGIVGGVVMRILPGQAQPEVFVTVPNQNGDCVGCHSVSADGTRMLVETHGALGTLEVSSASYQLSANSGSSPTLVNSMLKRAGFAALTPNGSKFLIQGAIGPGPTSAIASVGPAINAPGSFGPQLATLFETDSGKEIPDTGIVPYPVMPMFSVDGTLLVFNNMDLSGATAGHTLAVMDFDDASNKFGNLRTVYQHTNRYPAWPFFLPTVRGAAAGSGGSLGRRVIFALGECDFATQEPGFPLSPHRSNLVWLDIDTGVSALLNAANGLDASGTNYLPYGDHDLDQNYYPTVSPVAAGGYFWLFFTSKRNYGNLLVTDAPDSHPEAKKIWVSAIDIDAHAGSDPSHPAFLLPGQELESGNARAFAALEACHAERESCESGIDCCCGYCTEGRCECNTKRTCSKLNERCGSAADCCDSRLYCIGGFCGEVIGPQ